MKQLTEKQWRIAVDLLIDCVEISQTQIAQVINDPENPKHLNDLAIRFKLSKMTVAAVKRCIT